LHWYRLFRIILDRTLACGLPMFRYLIHFLLGHDLIFDKCVKRFIQMLRSFLGLVLYKLYYYGTLVLNTCMITEFGK
jgi:hypothetical protein